MSARDSADESSEDELPEDMDEELEQSPFKSDDDNPHITEDSSSVMMMEQSGESSTDNPFQDLLTVSDGENAAELTRVAVDFWTIKVPQVYRVNKGCSK